MSALWSDKRGKKNIKEVLRGETGRRKRDSDPDRTREVLWIRIAIILESIALLKN